MRNYSLYHIFIYFFKSVIPVCLQPTSVPFLSELSYKTEYIVAPVLFSYGGVGPLRDTFTLNAINLAACKS